MRTSGTDTSACEEPVDVVVSSDGARVYALCAVSSTLAIYDASDLSLLRSTDLLTGYSLTTGQRLAINDREYVAILMNDGSDLYAAIYEGRTDSWLDGHSDPGTQAFDLVTSYANGMDIASTADETFWGLGTDSGSTPGGAQRFDIDTANREITLGTYLDFNTVDGGDWSSGDWPFAVEVSDDGSTLYPVFYNTSSVFEVGSIATAYPYGTTSDECGSLCGSAVEKPKDLALVRDAGGADYAYIGWRQGGRVTQYDYSGPSCPAAFRLQGGSGWDTSSMATGTT